MEWPLNALSSKLIRFSPDSHFSQWHSLPSRIRGRRLCVGILCASPEEKERKGGTRQQLYVRMAPIGNWPQKPKTKNQATDNTQTTRSPISQPNQSERELNQKPETGCPFSPPNGKWTEHAHSHLHPQSHSRPLPYHSGKHIAHWFYLLIRTLCCFYLIFMPAAISISVIELSLSRHMVTRQVLAAPAQLWQLGPSWIWLVDRVRPSTCPSVRRIVRRIVQPFACRSMSKMVLRLIGVG